MMVALSDWLVLNFYVHFDLFFCSRNESSKSPQRLRCPAGISPESGTEAMESGMKIRAFFLKLDMFFRRARDRKRRSISPSVEKTRDKKHKPEVGPTSPFPMIIHSPTSRSSASPGLSLQHPPRRLGKMRKKSTTWSLTKTRLY